MEDREAFSAKMKAKLDEWGAELQQMEARTDQKHREHVATMREHHQMAQDLLKKVNQSYSDAWESIKKSAEEEWSTLKQSYAQAQARARDESKAA